MTDEAQWASRRTSFGDAAHAYAVGRPPYPLDALRWVVPDGATTALDLAAGTGRMSERLLELGLDVVAVEPLEEMRAFVPAAARAVAGTAEAIPLRDGAVDAVLVGQAFHWFDAGRALAEIARVLRPGGTLGLCWNLLDDTDRWTRRLADVIQADERSTAMGDGAKPPYSGAPGLRDPQRRIDRHRARYDADRVVAFVASRSQTILLAERDRGDLLDRVRAMCPDGEFDLALVCETWRGEHRS